MLPRERDSPSFCTFQKTPDPARRRRFAAEHARRPPCFPCRLRHAARTPTLMLMTPRQRHATMAQEACKTRSSPFHRLFVRPCCHATRQHRDATPTLRRCHVDPEKIRELRRGKRNTSAAKRCATEEGAAAQRACAMRARSITHHVDRLSTRVFRPSPAPLRAETYSPRHAIDARHEYAPTSTNVRHHIRRAPTGSAVATKITRLLPDASTTPPEIARRCATRDVRLT